MGGRAGRGWYRVIICSHVDISRLLKCSAMMCCGDGMEHNLLKSIHYSESSVSSMCLDSIYM